MSSAFVREEDGQWLHDIPPTMAALINYLSRENNGVRVYQQRSFIDEKLGKEVFVMSNGLNYSVGEDAKWYIVW